MQFISFDNVRKRDWLYLVPFLLVALVVSAIFAGVVAVYERMRYKHP